MKTAFTTLLVLSATLLSGPAQAATVTTTADSGPESSVELKTKRAVKAVFIFFILAGELLHSGKLLTMGPGTDLFPGIPPRYK